MKTYAVFAVLSLLVYSLAFDNPFRQDDISLCRYVSTIGIGDVFEATDFAFYRPGAIAVFVVEYALFGENSGAYIVFNYVLHVLISLGMGLVLRRIGLGPRAAFLAGGFFVVGVGHYGKKIMWACTSGPLVSVILSLAALWLVLGWLEISRRPRGGRGVARCAYPPGIAIALGAAPLFHEASLWTVPVVLAVVLIHGPRDWRGRIRHGLPALLVLPVWIAVLGVVSLEYPAYRVGWETLLDAPLYAVRYVGFMLAPVQQTSVLALPSCLDRLAGSAMYIHIVVGVLGVIALAWVVRRGSASQRTLGLWFVLWLVPFTFVRMPGSWLELRYVYGASIPYCGLLGHAFDVLDSRLRGPLKRLLHVAAAAVVLATVALIVLLERRYDRSGL